MPDPKTTRKRAATGGKKTRKPRAASARTKTGTGRSKAANRDQVLGRLKQDLGQARDLVVEEIDRVVEAARDRFSGGGEKAERRLREAQERMRKDLGRMRERLEQAADRAAATGRKIQKDERVQAAAETGLGFLQGLAGTLRGMAERVEASIGDARSYLAGQAADAGTYSCRGCGEVEVLRSREVLPSCARCGEKRFRKNA